MQLAAAQTRQTDDSAGSGFSRPSRKSAALALLLIVLVGWAFLPALHNGFVNFDDEEYVVGNAHVKAGLTWDGVRWAFTSTAAGNWHPLTWLSHMLDCELFGLNPWGHHLTSLMLHAANALLVFFVFSRMTGAIWRSFFVAAIFAVHPLRVESVAWASERKDVLSLLFWMLTLWSYFRYAIESKVQGPKSKLWYGLALFCFALGLMAKPSLVVLPLVLLLLDFWPLKRSSVSKLFLEKAPFFILAAASSLVTFFAQKRGGAVVAMDHLPLSARLENTVVSYVRYLGKIFWPADLSVFYPLPAHWPIGTVVLCGMLLLGISTGAVLLRGHRPFLAVGWFWFVGTLVPVIGLVQVGEQSMADRYSYISGLGVLLVIAWGIPELTGYFRIGLVASATMAGIIALCAATRQQVGYWKDSETLFRHALAVSEDNYGARVDLGNALLSQGRTDEAILQFREAVRLRPELPLPHDRLATALHARGRLDEAIEQFEEILKLKPNEAAAHNEIGAILFGQGHLNEAIDHYREAARLNPNAAATHYNWGIALCYQGRYSEAVGQLGEAVVLEPDNARAHYNLGIALSRTGRVDEAIREFGAALVLEPKAPKAHYQLGLALTQAGRREEAIAQFRAALALQPGYAEAAKELEKLAAPH